MQAAAEWDPWAVALGNASLLGVGYLLMRRWQIAIGAIVTSLVLVLIVSNTGQPGWPWRVILLVWWLATVAHGWRLANGRWGPAALVLRGQPRSARRQQIIAAAATTVVLATLVGLAIDSRRLTASAHDAHRAGDCDRATATSGRIGSHHRLVDPQVARQAGRTEGACQLLSEALDLVERGRRAQAAEVLAEYQAHPGALWEGASQQRSDLLLSLAADELDRAVGGDTDALVEGFDLLEQVLDGSPDRGDDVTAALASYEAELAADNPCDARDNVSWFDNRSRQFRHPELNRTRDAVRERAPEILLACGEERLGARSSSGPEEAREIFELVVTNYPDHPVAAIAADRVREANDQIVRDLLDWHTDPPGAGDIERYCFASTERPGYSRARAYAGEGPHRIVAHHFDTGLDPSLETTSLDDAVLVLCGSGAGPGRALGRDCSYLVQGDSITVPLHARAHTWRLFELRTGDLVDETTLEFGGNCPPLPDLGLVPNPDPPRRPQDPGAVIGYSHALAFSVDDSVEQQTIQATIREWVYP